MLVIGAMRPGYSQSTDAISELGARGTSNAALWNIFGFIVPGLLLAGAGKAIVDSADARQTWAGRLATWSLPAFELTVAGQGLIPAVMSNGELVRVVHSRSSVDVSAFRGTLALSTAQTVDPR